MNREDAFRLYVVWISPLIQIGLLTVLIYWLLLSLERISAAVKLKGLALAVILIALSAMGARFGRLHAITWLLENSLSFAFIILAVVFQPEVRRLFTRIGGLLPRHNIGDMGEAIDQIVQGVDYMSQRRIGALIVVERSDHLDNFINASPLDCQLSAKALASVFWKDSPLHDGAVIVRGGRIAAAGVILPLTENLEYKDLPGTRHRAGIGISEDTDALAVLVSEESGTISVADRGKLTRGLSSDDLAILLGRIFGPAARRGRTRS